MTEKLGDSAPPQKVTGRSRFLSSPRLREAAGETVAECTAVLCCCPCFPVNLLLVAAFRMQARILHRSVRRRRKIFLQENITKTGSFNVGDDFSIHGEFNRSAAEEKTWPTRSPSEEIVAAEKNILPAFANAGFWRSLSQRE